MRVSVSVRPDEPIGPNLAGWNDESIFGSFVHNNFSVVCPVNWPRSRRPQNRQQTNRQFWNSSISQERSDEM
jgi:hypothetical protein